MGGGPDKSGLSFGTTYVLSAASACIAETATFPFDIIKTRLMIQGEAAANDAAAAKRGLVGTGLGIVREEVRPPRSGPTPPPSSEADTSSHSRGTGYRRALQGPRPRLPAARHLLRDPRHGVRCPLGLPAAANHPGSRTCVCQVRVLARERAGEGRGGPLRAVEGDGGRLQRGHYRPVHRLAHRPVRPTHPRNASPPDPLSNRIWGLRGGSVKVQMQADGKRVLAGHAPRYKCVPPPHPHPTGRAAREAGAAVSAGRGIVDAFVTIGRQGGVSGLWKGVVPNCQRAGLVQLGDLTTYDAAKQRIMGLGEPPPLGLD